MSASRPDYLINKTFSATIGGIFVISTLISGGNVSINAGNLTQPQKIIKSSYVDIFQTYENQNGYNGVVIRPNYLYDNSFNVESIVMSKDKINNLSRLEQFALLEDNWNGNNANAFSKELVEKARILITSLDIQPEIFPTACDSIQIEYEKEDGSYLEIDLNMSDTCEVYEIKDDGSDRTYSISSNIETVFKVVNGFYEWVFSR